MFKKFGFLVAGLLAGNALAAASAPVWNNTDGAGTIARGGVWYSYGKDNGAVATMTDVAAGKSIAITVSATNESSSGGMGISLAKNDGVKDLSAYAGVCLTYSATQKFRFDVKTSGIEDYDYNGAVMPAHSKQDTAYIAFKDLDQEGWGVTVAFDASDVQAFQFSYKQSLYADTKTTKNTIVISSIALGNSCTNHPPVLTSAYAAINGKTVDIAEGATHEIPLADVFVDEDGDELTYTVKISGADSSVKLIDSLKSYTAEDVLRFTTYPNPKGDVKVVITAKDTHGNVKDFNFTMETEDVANAPVAVDFSFEVLEDSSYKSGLTAKMNNLKSMGSDADNDPLTLEIVDQPEHGTLSADVSTGIFTYAPDPDYNGADSFTYRFYETDNEESVSNLGTAHITVTPVNDAPEVTVVAKVFVDEANEEHAFGDTLVVDEDFAAFSVFIPVKNITVEDPDGEDDIVYSAKASDVVEASYSAMDDYYAVEISAIKNANGVAKVTFSAGDHKILVPTVICYVKVEPVADAPIANSDVYTVTQGATFTVDAKKGVLANDVNPDGDSKLTAVLDVDVVNGTLELKEDGSFTYTSDAAAEAEEDAFGYHVVNEDGLESKMVVVTLNVIEAPKIAEGVVDTIGKRLAALTEDFTTIKKYTKAEVLTWFIDGDKADASGLEFTVRSDDSLLAPTIASGIISVKAVPNACGEANVIVTATNKAGAATDLKIPAKIACVNDKPIVIGKDTVLVKADSGWSFTVYIPDYVIDVDGDSLAYTLNVLPAKISAEIKGDSLHIAAKEGFTFDKGTVYGIGVKAADATTYVTASVYFKIGEAESDAIKPVIAAPKASWQNAILANRGVAAMFDMQGRVMWKQKLPVSEAEVRAVAAGVQGRKILMVNKQTYTIK